MSRTRVLAVTQLLSLVALVPRLATPYVNRRAARYVLSAYPTTAHDTRVIAAAWLRVIGGGPAFQGDPGLLLEITREQPYVVHLKPARLAG